MARLSEKELEKLRALRESMISDGMVFDEEREEEKPKKENPFANIVLTEEEEKEIANTMRIWDATREQAIMIYRTAGSLKGLRYTNQIKERVEKNSISLEKLEDQLNADRAFISSIESMEEKYYDNYTRILSNEEPVAELYVLRKTNEQFEKLLAQRRPELEKRISRYYAIGTVVYYSRMIERIVRDKYVVTQTPKQLEQSRLLPGLRNTIRQRAEAERA